MYEMSRNLLSGIVAAIVITGAVAQAAAIPFQNVDVEYTAGAGPDKAMVVIDFSAVGGPPVAFGYEFDNTILSQNKAEDAVFAIADAGTLDLTYADFGGSVGKFVFSLTYDGYTIGTPNGFGAVPAPSIWNSESGETWTSSLLGITALPLDGTAEVITDFGPPVVTEQRQFYPWVGFTGSSNQAPATPIRPRSEIPEPASAALLAGLAGLALARRRRRAE